MCRLRPLVYSLGLNNALRNCFTVHSLSRASKVSGASTDKGPLDVKWLWLDFTLLLNPALQV
jgi:hypothetical protein